MVHKNKVNIAFITDDNYVMQTEVALLSLISNKNKDSIYDIFIITDNVSKYNIQKLLSYSNDNISITCINYNNKEIYDTTNYNVYSSTVLIKLKLDSILNNITKLLFLDSDIIVQKDLSELFNTNIDTYYIAGVKDITPTFYHINKNRIKYDNYFNTGVMLLNLELIRNEHFFENAINTYLQNPQKYYFPEQDLLNEIIKDKLKIISCIYNFITSNRRYTNKQLTNFYNEKINNNKIVILHYAGGCRPWRYYSVFYSSAWYQYFNKTLIDKRQIKKKFIPFFKTVVFLKCQIKILLHLKKYKEVGILR